MVPIVLVVDDDVASTVVLAKLLERLGCEVLVRADAESAVELALCGRVDVVSLDISMPHLDGYQMLALVRSHEHSRRLPSVPLIAVTGRVAPADKAHALAHGFAAHLGKPVLLVELRQALTRALTLRSELQRTRYSVDQADLVANLGELDHAGRGDELRTVAGLALALEQEGARTLYRALLLADEGRGATACPEVQEFAGLARAVGAAQLAACMGTLRDQLAEGGETLKTAAVLARAELDRVIFTLREQARR